MKQTLLDKVSIFLLKEGFTVKNLTRNCFDLLGRKNDQILLIKVLEDANSISVDFANDMTSIASCINASPIIISQKAGDDLENNVVYARFGVYTLNIETFASCIRNKMPFVKRTHAGLTAHIAGKKLKEKREEQNMSLASLSKKIGVTRRMIAKYEDESCEVTINKAMKLYDVFGHQVFRQVDVFSSMQKQAGKLESKISQKYADWGFETAETKKTPFDIIARKDREIVLTEMSDKLNPQMQSLSRLLDANSLVIFKNKKPKNVASMTKKEFMDFDRADELVRFLKEY